ncbi:TetR/AcrR family transcriptional regulator [Corynebacterium frankenforstense]|uniref:TetR/AcrR family transcriptional regulator n=1 Tax=Corynebacterium TaxID=1716 RepID=UPI00254B37D5|nr:MULTISPECIES: TetR/AcrR family transcriptional regulator [Corynebacterium]MDK6259625.1 TetR/AcrR family transcriptional regulator [Corynebacterium frankenforstense]MDK8894823.1 TetR/AcrR family transcriptional regulator [Corynebacterium sp. MSK006]
MSNGQRARGRPTKAVVTREKIADAALRVVVAKGYAALSMAAVARDLGVAPSALYNHVAGKQELLYMLEDAVMAQVDVTALTDCLAGSLSPREAVTEWAISYRDVLARHTPLIGTVAVMSIFGTRETAVMYENVVRVLRLAGVADEQVMAVIVAVESFVFGSAFDAEAPADIFDVPEGAPEGDNETQDERVETEALRSVLAHRPAGGENTNPYADLPFRLGLQVLVEGLIPG